jgi:hypothetical protein
MRRARGVRHVSISRKRITEGIARHRAAGDHDAKNTGNFATRTGREIAVVKGMIDRIAGSR